MDLSSKVQLVRSRIEKRFRQDDVVKATGLTLLQLKNMETSGAGEESLWEKYKAYVEETAGRPVEDGSPRVTVAIKRFISPSSNLAMFELGRLVEEYMDSTDTRMSDLVEQMKTSPTNIPLILTGDMQVDKAIRYAQRVPELITFINDRITRTSALAALLSGGADASQSHAEACPVPKAEVKVVIPALPAVVPTSVSIEQLLAAPGATENLTVTVVNSTGSEKLVLVSAK